MNSNIPERFDLSTREGRIKQARADFQAICVQESAVFSLIVLIHDGHPGGPFILRSSNATVPEDGAFLMAANKTAVVDSLRESKRIIKGN